MRSCLRDCDYYGFHAAVKPQVISVRSRTQYSSQRIQPNTEGTAGLQNVAAKQSTPEKSDQLM